MHRTAVGQGQPQNGTGEQRTNLAPLTDRFQGIGTPLGAIWMSGTTGSDRVPGPSTYWNDAVIMLDPATAETLRNDVLGAESDVGPVVIDELVEFLPTGLLVTSDALTSRVGASAFIAVDSDELVISALFGNWGHDHLPPLHPIEIDVGTERIGRLARACP